MWTFPPAGSRSRSETIRPGEGTQAGPVKVSVKKPAASHPARAGHPAGHPARAGHPAGHPARAGHPAGHPARAGGRPAPGLAVPVQQPA
jgi:hypothetical protein